MSQRTCMAQSIGPAPNIKSATQLNVRIGYHRRGATAAAAAPPIRGATLERYAPDLDSDCGLQLVRIGFADAL